jgi:hypothetical protein
MKQVCVLGNGQLGRMLRQAGEPLGIAVWPVGLEADPEAVPFQQSVITAEIERWPETALTRELARHPAFVNRDVPIIADRLTQKQLFDKLGSPPPRGSCWRIKASGRRCLPALANWRSLSVALAVTTAAASGVCGKTRSISYRPITTASASSSRGLTSPASVAGGRPRP